MPLNVRIMGGRVKCSLRSAVGEQQSCLGPEEQAWRPLDTSYLLIVADFFPEYDYVNKTQQAQ
jgi:hypothetical protein